MDSKFKLVIGVFGLAAAVLMGTSLITTVGAGEIVVKQSAFTGDLTVWETPGPKFKNFGETTTYKKSDQYSFSAYKDQGGVHDESIKCRFNDGGHGNVSGTFQFDLPANSNQMKTLHMKFRSQDGIRQQLIRPAVERAVYLSGPLMSSKESSAERRADLLTYIEDQVKNGIYKTQTKEEKMPDPITGKDKTVLKVELVHDEHGVFARQEKSPLSDLGVVTYSYNINGLTYDPEVEAQIKGQQQLTMNIQTAIAQSKEAEQRALTVSKQGEANAAQAKAEQEVIKMKEVTQAEKEKAVAILNATREKEVAELAVQNAELKKKEQTLLGEGEAARARAMMQANGYLPEKLAVYKSVALVAAESMGKQRQTPDVVMGSTSRVGLDDLMQMSLAKQLGVAPSFK